MFILVYFCSFSVTTGIELGEKRKKKTGGTLHQPRPTPPPQFPLFSSPPLAASIGWKRRRLHLGRQQWPRREVRPRLLAAGDRDTTHYRRGCNCPSPPFCLRRYHCLAAPLQTPEGKNTEFCTFRQQVHQLFFLSLYREKYPPFKKTKEGSKCPTYLRFASSCDGKTCSAALPSAPQSGERLDSRWQQRLQANAAGCHRRHSARPTLLRAAPSRKQFTARLHREQHIRSGRDQRLAEPRC